MFYICIDRHRFGLTIGKMYTDYCPKRKGHVLPSQNFIGIIDDRNELQYVPDHVLKDMGASRIEKIDSILE